MNARFLLRLAILVFWTLFWGLSVVDKILPDVQHLWVGKDFFALFIKFFASLGLKDPLLRHGHPGRSVGLEAANFVLYLLAMDATCAVDGAVTDRWFFRAIPPPWCCSACSPSPDQVFGDRFQLLEHGLFWLVLLASWIAFRFDGTVRRAASPSVENKRVSSCSAPC